MALRLQALVDTVGCGTATTGRSLAHYGHGHLDLTVLAAAIGDCVEAWTLVTRAPTVVVCLFGGLIAGRSRDIGRMKDRDLGDERPVDIAICFHSVVGMRLRIAS